MSSSSAKAKHEGKVIGWADGCFDCFHVGHSNALRQARELCDYLIVGVHSDADIRQHKGPTVMREDERYTAVRACKWVDEVVEGAPYVTEVGVIDSYHVNFVIHGDDVVLDAEGGDCYAAVKAAGRFRTVPRTPGVSTTDLVGRMLLLQHRPSPQEQQPDHHGGLENEAVEQAAASPYTRVTKFVPSTRKIVQVLPSLSLSSLCASLTALSR